MKYWEYLCVWKRNDECDDLDAVSNSPIPSLTSHKSPRSDGYRGEKFSPSPHLALESGLAEHVSVDG